MKQIAYVGDLYVNRLKIKSIVHNGDDVNILLLLISDDMDSLHERIASQWELSEE